MVVDALHRAGSDREAVEGPGRMGVGRSTATGTTGVMWTATAPPHRPDHRVAGAKRGIMQVVGTTRHHPKRS